MHTFKGRGRWLAVLACVESACGPVLLFVYQGEAKATSEVRSLFVCGGCSCERVLQEAALSSSVVCEAGDVKTGVCSVCCGRVVQQPFFSTGSCRVLLRVLRSCRL